jgi:hypothetical protein
MPATVKRHRRRAARLTPKKPAKSKTARFRDRMEGGCALYRRAILYYPFPCERMLTQNDHHLGTCDHLQCYKFALEQGATFIDENGMCLRDLYKRGKYKLIEFLWDYYTKKADHHYLLYFSMCVWHALAHDFLYVQSTYNRTVRLAHTRGMLQYAVTHRDDSIDSLLPFDFKLGDNPMTCLRYAVDHREKECIQIFAKYI